MPLRLFSRVSRRLRAPLARRSWRRSSPQALAVEPLEGRRLLAVFPLRVGGAGTDTVTGMVRLPDDSTILTGHFEGTINFGGKSVTSWGEIDIFVAKLNPDGSCAWATRAGGTSSDRPYNGTTSIALLADGKSVVIAGCFTNQATFGSTVLSAPAVDQPALFVAKVNADGTFAWANRSGGGDVIHMPNVTALADGSAVVAGNFYRKITFGNTILTQSEGTREDIFVAKIDANGQFVWARRAGGKGGEPFGGVVGQADGSVIITGTLELETTFGGTTLKAVGDGDIFIAKLNSSGTFVWAKRLGGGITSESYVIHVQPSVPSADGSLIVTGRFRGSLGLGGTKLVANGPGAVFVAKVNANGQCVWAAKADNSLDYGFGANATPAADGSVIIAGFFKGTAGFGGTTLTSLGVHDGFVAKLDAKGQFLWARRIGGVDDDYGGPAVTLSDGSIVVAGFFKDTISVGGTTLLSSGWTDMYVAKLTASGSFNLPPAAPSSVVGTADNAAVQLAWKPPVGNGAPAVESYFIQYRPANQRIPFWTNVPSLPKATDTSRKVTGLTNGVAYIFRVAANTPLANGPYSAPSAAVTPRTVPGMPTALVGVGGDGLAKLTWKPPTSTGGTPITGYVVQHTTDLATWTTVPGLITTTSATVVGLVNGGSYTFRVAAQNAAGTGGFYVSDLFSVWPKGAPGVPQNVSVAKGNGQVAVSWMPPATNGGSPLTSYRIIYAKKVGASWGPWVTVNRSAALPTNLTIGGLTNGSTYVFHLAAVNALGSSPNTTPGVLVTPGA